MNIYDNSYKITILRRNSMKKLLVIGVIAVVAIVVALSGCAGEKVYSYTDSNGICGEVITNDSDVQNFITDTGYTEGSCDVDSVGTCTYSWNTGSFVFEVKYYYPSDFTASQAESSCDTLGGTWAAE
jgi:hypothetical protein